MANHAHWREPQRGAWQGSWQWPCPLKQTKTHLLTTPDVLHSKCKSCQLIHIFYFRRSAESRNSRLLRAANLPCINPRPSHMLHLQYAGAMTPNDAPDITGSADQRQCIAAIGNNSRHQRQEPTHDANGQPRALEGIAKRRMAGLVAVALPLETNKNASLHK
jgi:hypothetical protein